MKEIIVNDKCNYEIKVDLYYKDSKMKGYNIVKNNDMLQYHYFSQDYNIVKISSIIAIFKLKYSDIWYDIGFASLMTSPFNKLFRNMYFGLNIFLKIKEIDESHDEINLFNFMTLSRVVLLPNFRGLGLIRPLLSLMTENIFKIKELDNIYIIEAYSNMMRMFNFHPKEYIDDIVNLYKNVDLKTIQCRERFDENHKYFNKKMSLAVFCVNDIFYDRLQEFYRLHYNLNIDVKKLFNTESDYSLIKSKEYYDEYIESKHKNKIIPLFLKLRGY